MKKKRSSNSRTKKSPAPPRPAPKAAVAQAAPLSPSDDEPEESHGEERAFSIVGIGASAGGYEAFLKLLADLPGDTGMAFVMVQHLDPKHESMLAELLARSTRLPVHEAKNGMRVRPNQIYVMPANVNISISGGQLRLLPRKTDVPHMPVDSFFRSLAADWQHRAIGIVLSGTGSDGTLGLQAIKGEGGITMAQDEKSAKFFGMPGSAIAANCVDLVLPPESIARELSRIARHPYVGRPSRPQPRRVSAVVETPENEKLFRERG